MAAEFRVFLSAVTSEFGAARDAVANDLQARDLHLRVQRSLRQEPGADTVLRLLHDYIRDCSAVVCVIGTHSGARPSPAEAAPCAHLLPPGITEASYTQWEFFFARAYKRRLSIYVAAADYRGGRGAPRDDFPELQAAFFRHIKAAGLHYTPFSNRDQLRAEVLKEPWPERLRAKPIVLPYASLGSLFKGREAFLHRLRQSLTRGDGGTTAIVSKALYGMGGIGKTRAAVEYAWAYREDYTALLFTQADSQEELRRNLAGLAGPLLLPEREAAEEEVRLRAVLGRLAANPGWLLILDNVDAPTAMAEVDRLMGRLAGGHVVLTSRFDRFARQVEPIELDALSLDAAAAFLLDATDARRRKAEDDEVAARELAEELGRLALALEQAAATIDKMRCGFRRYLEIWQSNREKVVGWARAEIAGYHHAVAATWQTSIDELSGDGRHLLERLAYLAPDPVPMFLLEVPVPDTQAEDQEDALSDLSAISLAIRDADGERFAVHRLVQDVTRRSLDAAASRARITEALGWVNAAFSGDPQDVRSWARLDPLVPHAQSVAQWADREGIAEPTALLLNQLGVLLHKKSLHAQAEPLYRRALAIDEVDRRPNDLTVARSLNNLAQLLRETNRLAEAEPMMRRALEVSELNLGPSHPLVATALNDLGSLLQDANRLAESEPLYRRALKIAEARLGPNHPTVGIVLNNLAGLMENAKRLTEAQPLYERALSVAEKNFGPDHPTVAIRLNNLALSLRSIDPLRLGEAEAMMRRALAINESSFGPDHPTVARGLNNLAQIMQDINCIVDAEQLMRRALAIEEKSFGPDHPDVAICLHNLAQLLQASERAPEAEPLILRALAIFFDFERKTARPHPQREAAFQNYASLLAAMGKSEAEIKAASAALTCEGGK